MTDARRSTKARPAGFIGPVAACAIALSVSGLGQDATFRSGVEAVPIYVTVRGADGRLVTNLTREAFQVFDDGKPVDLTVFSTDLQPLSVAIMLDTSQSQLSYVGTPGIRYRTERAAALTAFIEALRPEDRASLGTFGMEIAVGANLTHDAEELTRVLREEVWGGGGTPLWQAIRAGMSAIASEPGRHVVLAVTDGRDTGSLPGFPGGRSGAEEQALRENCMVYAVLVASQLQMDGDMVSLANATGGGHAFVPRGSDMRMAFAQIAEELRHQYLIGFAPARDGRAHRIEVRTTQPGAKVSARRSYVAETGR